MIEKYYAVRWKEGNTAIKFGSWNTVSKTIQGHPGVTFKSFLLKEDAEEWLLKDSIPFRDKDTPFQKDKIYMFVDGSFSSKRMVSGWGFVAIRNEQIIHQDNGILTEADTDLTSRNICGELKAATEAILWYSSAGLDGKGVIVCDYIGIANWALGFWSSSSPVAVDYIKKVTPHLEKIEFEKCSGHSGTIWNDYADELTRKGYLDENN